MEVYVDVFPFFGETYSNPDYESGDSRFESWRGRFFPSGNQNINALQILESSIVQARSVFFVLSIFLCINRFKKEFLNLV